MTQYLVPLVILLIILISIQYTLNKIIILLKDIKSILLKQYYDENR
ncbi:hypothetical protein [Alkaliphilus crotonatoxidans]